MMSEYANSPLLALSDEQWEALCDGCGKCCLVKLQDDDTQEVFYTNVHCEYLDSQCRCQVYAKRQQKKADCVVLTKDNLQVLDWLPASCAYKRFHAGQKTLPYIQVKIQFPIVSETHVADSDLVQHVIDDDLLS